MIRFQKPSVLLLLPLSFLPILLHLLSQKRKKVFFTYIFILKEIISEQLAKKRLMDLLILLIRCLLIACLLFYFAKPSLDISKEKNVIVVIDNSFSTMQKFLNYNKFEVIKKKAKEFLKFLTIEKIKLKLFILNETLIQISKGSEYLQPDNKMLDELENLRPSFSKTNLYVLFNYLANNMEDKDLDIIIFTDLAKNQFLKEQVFKNTFDSKINVFFCYPSYVFENYFIENLEIVNLDKFIEINYYPINLFQTQNEINVKLKLFNNVVDSHNIEFNTHKNYKFKYAYESEENIWGSIFLALNDCLIEDNNFYFTYKFPEYKKFICILNEPKYILSYKSKKFYLEKLNSKNLNLEIHYIDEENINDLFDQNKNFILIGLPKIKYLIDKIYNKNAIIFLEEGIDYEDYEEALAIEIASFDESVNTYFLKTVDETFKDFITQFDYEKISFYKKFYLQPYKLEYNKWQILLLYNDNSPALIKRNNIYVFTSSLDINYSNLIYKPFFVGFLNYVSNLNNVNNLKNYYYISEIIPLGDIKEVRVKIGDVKENFYEKTKEGIIFRTPGIYEIVKKNDETLKIAVNTPPEESYISFIDKAFLKNNLKKIGIKDVNFIEIDNDVFIKKLQKLCFGKDYSNVFLFIFLFLFLLENMLSRLLGKLL